MRPKLDRPPLSSPVFAVEVSGIVIVVTRARDASEACRRGRSLAQVFYGSRLADGDAEGGSWRWATEAEVEALMEVESRWHGDASVAAVFLEPAQ